MEIKKFHEKTKRDLSSKTCATNQYNEVSNYRHDSKAQGHIQKLLDYDSMETDANDCEEISQCSRAVIVFLVHIPLVSFPICKAAHRKPLQKAKYPRAQSIPTPNRTVNKLFGSSGFGKAVILCCPEPEPYCTACECSL